MMLNIADILKIDGEVSADGDSSKQYGNGGGSGGSIWIKTNLMQVLNATWFDGGY